MHRISQHPLATNLGPLALFVFALIGLGLVVLGGNEAHVLSGVSHNRQPGQSSPEAKLIVGFGIILMAGQANIVRRLRATQRGIAGTSRGRDEGPPA